MTILQLLCVTPTPSLSQVPVFFVVIVIDTYLSVISAIHVPMGVLLSMEAPGQPIRSQTPRGD